MRSLPITITALQWGGGLNAESGQDSTQGGVKTGVHNANSGSKEIAEDYREQGNKDSFVRVIFGCLSTSQWLLFRKEAHCLIRYSTY
jgi:hypothetical protein